MDFYQVDRLLEFHDMPLRGLHVSFEESTVLLITKEHCEYTNDYNVVHTLFKGVSKFSMSNPVGLDDFNWEVYSFDYEQLGDGSVLSKIYIIQSWGNTDDSFATVEIISKEIVVERKVIYGLKGVVQETKEQ